MIKNFITELKLAYKLGQERVELSTLNLVWKTGEFQDVPVYHDDLSVNRICSITSDYPCAAIGHTDKGDVVIVVNRAFKSLDKDVQTAILTHELAHLKLGHLDKIGKLKRDISYEYEADAYSQSTGADMIGALKILLTKHESPSVKKELARRLAHLQA